MISKQKIAVAGNETRERPGSIRIDPSDKDQKSVMECKLVKRRSPSQKGEELSVSRKERGRGA